MPRWLPPIISRIRMLATERKVQFTLKALRELTMLGAGLDADDAVDVLAGLTAGDSDGRLVSRATGEWMYVFKPRLAGTVIYVKVVLRAQCVLVSFHEDIDDDEDEEDP